MKKALIIFIFISSIGILGYYFLTRMAINVEKQYQNDADLLRLEHIVYWTDLLEDYYKKKQFYPFQNKLKSKNNIAIVRISTKNQQLFFTPKSEQYNSRYDINYNGRLQEFSVKDFVSELETVLGHKIDEKYDIQKVPVNSPIGYNYFISEDGYLVWGTCISCGVTKISTLLMDGFTPTVNIVSEGMIGKVTKALTRDDMINHPTFIEWKNKPFIKEKYVRTLEQENHSNSKQ